MNGKLWFTASVSSRSVALLNCANAGAFVSAFTLGVILSALQSETALAAPLSLTLGLGGQPSDTIVYNGSTTSIPQGMSFEINVDTSTADTWGPTDYGYFPADSVFVTVPDLGIDNVLVTTPLGYFEDESPQERAGISDNGTSGAFVYLPSSGNTQIGDPNVIDTIPSLFGTGSMTGGFSFVLETGDTLYDPTGTDNFGASSLTQTIPEPPTIMLLATFGFVVATRRSIIRS